MEHQIVLKIILTAVGLLTAGIMWVAVSIYRQSKMEGATI